MNGQNQAHYDQIQIFQRSSLMQNPDSSNSQIGLEQKNTIMQAWSDFKDSVFNVLFVMLDKNSQDNEEESLGGLIFQSGLDYLQIMAFPFSNLVLPAWNGGGTLQNLISFFRKFNVSTYLPNAPFPAFLFILYSLVFIILLILIDIVYVSYSFTKKKFKFTFPLVILAQIVPLFVTVLFLPITETLLIVVQCQNVNNEWRMTSFPDVVCWQGWHLFHTSITLLFVTLFVIISTIVALALFEPRMTTKKLTARQNSNGEVVFIVNKIVLQFFFSFSPFPGSTFYVTILFLLAFWQFWCYTIKKPYYSKVATKFFRICSTYYFWTALMLMLGQLLQSYGFTGALIIWISGLPFFAVVIYFDETIRGESLHSNNLKFKTGEELQTHLSVVLELICNQKEDKVSGTLLIGYIEKHKQLCNEADCPLKIIKKKRLKDADSMESMCGQLIKKIDRMYRTGLKKFPESTKLRLSYAFFHLEQMQNKKKAYEQFTQTGQLEPSFDQQFNIYRFKKIIRENLEDRDENESDLVETIRFDNHVSLLEEAMIHSAKLHKEFWAELKEEKPDLKKLNTVGSQITQTGNTITENYKQIVRISSCAYEVLYSYANYLILVNEDFSTGKEFLSNARKIYEDKLIENKVVEDASYKEEQLDKKAVPMISVQCSSTRTPIITNSNLLFTEISGYSRSQLFEKELGTIAPHLFRQTDTNCFSFAADERERESFLRHKFNHLVSISYQTIPRPDNEWHVLIKLSTVSNNKMIFLAQEQGKITDFNLVALHALKEEGEEHKNLQLSDIGLKNIGSGLVQKQNGVLTTIKIKGKERQCLAQVEPVMASVMKQQEGEEQESALLQFEEKNVGLKVVISKYDRRSNQVKIHEEMSYGVEDILDHKSFDDEVLDIYQNPNALDVLISQLAETKHFEEPHVPFELKEKITTMRLLNNEIKMVYCQTNENDYSDVSAVEAEEDEREVFKFDDENYQAKLKAAINTNLNHEEVSSLRIVSILFLVGLFALCITQLHLQNASFNTIKDFLDQMNERATQYSLLSSNILATLDGTNNFTSLINHNSNHHVTFETDISVNVNFQNNFTITKNLKDAVIFLNSRLVSYFQTPNNFSDVLLVLDNYFNNIYPAFFRYPTYLPDKSSQSFIFAGTAFAITCIMMAFWIFISLKIDKKRYDIMIWFLDIPIPYVAHLGNHCDLYLKQYVSVKELGQKGIPEEEEEQFQEFSVKKNANANDEQIEEQIKVRKSLISKNKKETLLSKINISALKVLWLLVFGLFFSCLVLGLTQKFYTQFKFLKDQWTKSATLVTVDNTIYLNLEATSRSLPVNSNLPLILNQLRLEHQGVITESHVGQFNLDIFTTNLVNSASIYDAIFFKDLCLSLSLSASDLQQCQMIVGNKLQSGYEVYSKYLITPETVMSSQIAIANRKYLVPVVLKMLEIWNTELSISRVNIMNLCTIMLYIFIIISLLCFLLFWLYYLRKINVEINQTIQMLNMIPFKLLPKSRKETKAFIAWIIQEANKTKHENQ